MRLIQLDPREIDVGTRARQTEERGEMVALMRSMERVGQLQPIGVVEESGVHRLVLGGRRLDAAVTLGWETIQAVVLSGLDDTLKLLEAERDENECRKPLTLSESVALADKIKACLQRVKAPEAPSTESAKSGTPPSKPLRDQVADRIGVGRETLRKAAKVVQAAKEQPEKFEPVRQQMDATNKVDAAYRAVQSPEKANEAVDLRAVALRKLDGLAEAIKKIEGIDQSRAAERVAQLRSIIEGKMRAANKVPADEIERQATVLWGLYPRHEGKGAAIRAAAKAIELAGFAVLEEAVAAFAEAKRGEDPQFIPHMSTWMNQRRWEDDRSSWRKAPPKTKLDGLDSWIPPEQRNEQRNRTVIEAEFTRGAIGENPAGDADHPDDTELPF